jgi:(5-formylfuran-3-yl)methyl phosphate synthase
MPKLLVSVRNVHEARMALDAGVDVIDVKEPLAGALGAASPAVIEEVVRLVDGRCLTSLACGELLETAAEVFQDVLRRAQTIADTRPVYAENIKVGLAGCGPLNDWPTRWRRFLALVPNESAAVAVVYADWNKADAPRPDEVIDQAASVGCPTVLIDTFDKHGDGLLRLWSMEMLAAWIDEIHARDMQVAVAGRLTLDDAVTVASLGPEYVGVRGAVCSPDRNGSLDQTRLLRLRQLLAPRSDWLPVGGQ